MKGLLYKDLCTLTSRYKKNFLVVFVLYIVWAILFDMPFMLYALVFVLGMYVQSAISFDEYSHWDMYGHTLPVRPAALVGSKYILGGGAILAGCLLAAAAFVLSPVASKGDSAEILLGILSAATTSTFYFSLSVPLSYKFGCDRARTAVLLVLAGIFCLVMLVFTRLPDGALDGLNAAADASGLSDEVLSLLASAAVAGVSLVLVLATWGVSTAIYRKKEY